MTVVYIYAGTRVSTRDKRIHAYYDTKSKQTDLYRNKLNPHSLVIRHKHIEVFKKYKFWLKK